MSSSDLATPKSTASTSASVDNDVVYKASSIFKAYKGIKPNVRRTIT